MGSHERLFSIKIYKILSRPAMKSGNQNCINNIERKNVNKKNLLQLKFSKQILIE